MSVVVVGDGISGLCTCLELKLLSPELEVLLIARGGASNSTISGQRYRTRFKGAADIPEISRLFCAERPASDPDKVATFFSLAQDRLRFWTSIDPRQRAVRLLPLESRDSSEWFGPQVGPTTADGHGRGGSVVAWLRALAAQLGVRFLKGEVLKIDVRPTGDVASLLVRNDSGNLGADELHVAAMYYVFAGGGCGGSMFASTNVPNYRSTIELLYEAGATINAATVVMLHIAGRSDTAGRVKHGCHETDLLAGAQVHLRDATGFVVRDPVMEEMFSTHSAHYHFPFLAKRLLARGGVAKYSTSTSVKFGRVSHHYSHLGIAVHPDMRVRSLQRSYAVGDCSGVSTLLGYQPRLPGSALSYCLVSAHIAATRITSALRTSTVYHSIEIKPGEKTVRDTAPINFDLNDLVRINTLGLMEYMYEPNSEKQSGWLTNLRRLSSEMDSCTLYRISRLTALACQKVRLGATEEPVDLNDAVYRLNF